MAEEPTDSFSTVTETKTLLDYGLEIVSEKPMDQLGSNMMHLRHRERESFDVGKMLEQVEQLERDLVRKEQETMNVLNQLEATKKFVQGLKADFMAASSSSLVDHHPAFCTGAMLAELMRTQSSFNRASLALSIIQSSLESLNKKMRIDELQQQQQQVEDRELVVTNVDSEQLKKMKDASRYEVSKAIREIERTKNSIIIAEMRLNAAKKMEEAAKAVEAIAVAERKCAFAPDNTSDPLQNPDGVIKFIDKTIIGRTQEVHGNGYVKGHEAKPGLQEPDRGIYYRRRTHGENGPRAENHQPNKHKQYRSSRSGRRQNTGSELKKESRAVSIGAILTRKLSHTSQDDDQVMKKRLLKYPKEEHQHLSLSQRLKEPCKLILNLSRASVEKQVVVPRSHSGLFSNPLYSEGSIKRASSSSKGRP